MRAAVFLLFHAATSLVHVRRPGAARRGVLSWASPSPRRLHDLAPVLESGDLDVGDGHTIYYQVHGTSPQAPMALFLHGGPGAGCFASHARFFDPAKWRVCLVDQRGCGRSRPLGELRGNTTPDLVGDLEKLRVAVGVDTWAGVLGGSWGSTLALAYARRHPASVAGLVLRGVCTMRAREIDWLFSPGGGAAALAPRAWRAFADHVALGVVGDGGGGGGDGGDDDDLEPRAVLHAYHARLTGADTGARDRAARAWMQYEGAVSSISSRRGVAKFVKGAYWRFEDQQASLMLTPTAVPETLYAAPPCWSSFSAPPPPPLGAAAANLTAPKKKNHEAAASSWVPAQPMLTCHYSVYNGFFPAGGDILDDLGPLRDLPAIAVQGGLDTICPPTTAFELHSKWPELELRLVTGAGHSQYDPDITHELLQATDALFLRVTSPSSTSDVRRLVPDQSVAPPMETVFDRIEPNTTRPLEAPLIDESS